MPRRPSSPPPPSQATLDLFADVPEIVLPDALFEPSAPPEDPLRFTVEYQSKWTKELIACGRKGHVFNPRRRAQLVYGPAGAEEWTAAHACLCCGRAAVIHSGKEPFYGFPRESRAHLNPCGVSWENHPDTLLDTYLKYKVAFASNDLGDNFIYLPRPAVYTADKARHLVMWVNHTRVLFAEVPGTDSRVCIAAQEPHHIGRKILVQKMTPDERAFIVAREWTRVLREYEDMEPYLKGTINA